MSGTILIRGGWVVDPADHRDERADVFIGGGRVLRVPATIPAGTEIVDARGLVVAPAFVDLHAHFREPGGEAAETIETGSRAAARGGFGTVVVMPNTRPPLDNPERVAWVRQRGDEVGLARVVPSACVSVGRAGEALTDMPALAAAGAGAFTDDGATVKTEELLVRALQVAKCLGLVVMDHAQDPAFERNGVMHEGPHARRHGLPGIPAEAEIAIVRRDVELAERTGTAVHIQHVSAAGSVAILRAARRRGARVSGELTPHHVALTDADVEPADANYKMNPPLRSAEDREALIAGVVDGTLQAFATDHAPHTAESKNRGFREAPFGVVGLETAVGITYTELVRRGLMDVRTWVERWTEGPARVLGIPPPTLRPGSAADVVLLDLESSWTVRAEAFVSRSRNTPFEGRALFGRAVRTVLGGRTTWTEPAACPR